MRTPRTTDGIIETITWLGIITAGLIAIKIILG